ncbi:MAG: DUF6452 family protein [Salinivirgaceae bacterium]
MKKFLILVILSGVIGWLSSCTSEDAICPGEKTSQFRIGFTQTIDTTTIHYLVYQTLPSDSGLVNDTIYSRSIKPGYVYLPVDITADSTWFMIGFVSEVDSNYYIVTDTITYTYTKEPILTDLECGFTMEFLIDTFYYTTNHIDSALLISKQINNEKINHVEILY